MNLVDNLFAIAFLAAPLTAAASDRDDAGASQPSASKPLLRGGGGVSRARTELDARLLFPSSPPSSFDPFADGNFVRTGLDRSLCYVNYDVEFSLPLDPEQWDAIAGYIHEHSKDGDDDGPDAPPEEEEEAPEAAEAPFHRGLQAGDDGHGFADHGGPHAHHFLESSCNVGIDAAPCVDWSAWTDGALRYPAEVRIPCGTCVRLDASPGEPLYGATLDFDMGLDVVGKLLVPNDANVELVTRYVYVQGLVEMPPPAAGSTTGGIPSEGGGGDRVVITLWGTDDLTFAADVETDNAHHAAKGVNNKAIVVAGGEFFSGGDLF